MARLLPILLAAALLGVCLGSLVTKGTSLHAPLSDQAAGGYQYAKSASGPVIPRHVPNGFTALVPVPADEAEPLNSGQPEKAEENPAAELKPLELTKNGPPRKGSTREPAAVDARVDFEESAVAAGPSSQRAYVPLDLSPPENPKSQPAPLATAAQRAPDSQPASGPIASPVRTAPPLAVSPSPDALRAVVEQAAQISDRGYAMALRGMLFAGSLELIKSLELVAQSLDVRDGNGRHTAALAFGLTALDEARDFVSSPLQPGVINVAQIVSTHKTPVLKRASGSAASGGPVAISPVIAQQQYYGFAQAQLAQAAGGMPVSSQTLYRLGRIRTAMSVRDASPQAFHLAQSLVYHQAALWADSANAQAANELGVLYARLGQLAESRQMLVHSVSVSPQRASWHNLAEIHHRLGEEDLAKRAEYERDQLAARAGTAAVASERDSIRWVDARSFAQSGRSDLTWPQPPPAADAVSASQRR